MRRQRGGFALADFVTGTVVFSSVILGFMSLTQGKFRVLDAAVMRTHAVAAAEAEIDAIRVGGLKGKPAGDADRDGFRRVRTFDPLGKIPTARGVVEARALRMQDGAAHRLLEVRVKVAWRDTSGENAVYISTVATQ